MSPVWESWTNCPSERRAISCQMGVVLLSPPHWIVLMMMPARAASWQVDGYYTSLA
jgi:hypothetical protein